MPPPPCVTSIVGHTGDGGVPSVWAFSGRVVAAVFPKVTVCSFSTLTTPIPSSAPAPTYVTQWTTVAGLTAQTNSTGVPDCTSDPVTVLVQVPSPAPAPVTVVTTVAEQEPLTTLVLTPTNPTQPTTYLVKTPDPPRPVTVVPTVLNGASLATDIPTPSHPTDPTTCLVKTPAPVASVTSIATGSDLAAAMTSNVTSSSSGALNAVSVKVPSNRPPPTTITTTCSGVSSLTTTVSTPVLSSDPIVHLVCVPGPSSISTPPPDPNVTTLRTWEARTIDGRTTSQLVVKIIVIQYTSPPRPTTTVFTTVPGPTISAIVSTLIRHV